MAMCRRYYFLRDAVETAYRDAREVSPEHIDEHPDVIDAMRTLNAHLEVCEACRGWLDQISGHQSKPVNLLED